jgi:hypothetical protein
MALDFPPYSSFSHYGLGEFTEFIEEFEHAVQLLQSESHTKHRIALVIIDSLAERVLVTHARTRFRAAEVLWFFVEKQMTRDEQARIMRDFNAKVNFALETPETGDGAQPLLDEVDAEIFRVAHRYRNAAYHRGRHNPAVTGPMSRLYAAAVARAFCRGGSSYAQGGMDDSKLAHLDRFAWREPGDPRGYISFPAAAERITGELVSSIEVDISVLARSLRADLRERIGAVEAILDRVRSRGIREDILESLLAGAQYWAANRGDPVLTDLISQRLTIIKSLSSEAAPSTELVESYQRIELAISDRRRELEEATRLQFDLGSTGRIEGRARRVSSSKGEAALLRRYQLLDQDLEQLEEAVDWVDWEVDREIEQAAEIARGK